MLCKLAVVSLSSPLSVPLLATECSVDIRGNDQTQFNTNVITVDRSYKQFTVNLSHPGNLPKNVMGHDWVLSAAADMQGVVTDGMASGLDKDYLKPDDSRVITHTKLIGSGEKDSVASDVPKLKEGEWYMFFCTFSGHSALMKGTLTLRWCASDPPYEKARSLPGFLMGVRWAQRA